MNFQQCAILVVVVVILCLSHCGAQVTFSTGWNAGKRAMDNPDFEATMKSATAIYHLLINQMRQLALCAAKNDDFVDAASGPFFTRRA